jgi:hypothetical protein
MVIMWDDNFQISNWIRKLAYGYSYIRSSLSAGDKTTIETWFLKAATYWDGVQHNWSKLRFPNRLSDNYTSPVSPYNPGTTFGITHWGGPTMHGFNDAWVNIPATTNTMVGIVGILLNNTTLKNNAKRFAKEWMMFNLAPDGTVGDQYRWHTTTTNPPRLGYLYAGTVIGSIVALADHFARIGDFELYNTSITGGLYGWEGSGKTLLKALRRYSQLTLGERGLPNGISVYASTDATLSASERIGPGTTHNQDTFMIPANVYYRDALVKQSYTRTMPSSPTSSGYDVWGGDWGTYPSVRFMFGQMEDVHFPYPGGITPDPTTGLLARYTFEAGAGTSAISSINAPTVNATLVGGYSYEPGIIGNFGLQMDGSAIGTVSGLLGSPANITITGYIQLTGSTPNGHTFVNIGDYVGLRVYDTGRLRGFYWNGSAIQGLDYFGAIGSGWNHVAYTHTNGRNELYLNGVLVANSVVTPIIYTGRGSNTAIGNHAAGSTGFDLKGRLDEVRVYNRVLTQADIVALLVEAPSPPTVTITSPSSTTPFNTNSNSVVVSGNATDNVAITTVTGTCPTCTPSTLVITCTNCNTQNATWITGSTVLSEGSNTFTITATDNQGSQSTDFITINYTPTPSADFYVSLTGSNGNNGTSPSTAWRTIQHAADNVIPGSTVQIGAGTFNERVTVNISGTSVAPIVFKGVRSGGTYNTIIDGSLGATGWVTAPEIGSGVYKANLGSPQALTSNGKNIWKISDQKMNCTQTPCGIIYTETGNAYLTKASNNTLSIAGSTVFFWDSISALFGNKSNGTTYLRFRNGENPNTMNVKVAPSGGVITINSKNYVTIQDLKIVGGEIGVNITGTSTGVQIKDNTITHGRNRIALHTGNPTNTVISGNILYPDMLGFINFTPGDREVESVSSYSRIVNRWMYDVNKFIIGTSEVVEFNIVLAGTSTGTVIEKNDISRGIVGIVTYQSPSNTDFRDNSCYYFSDMCWYMNGDNVQNFRFSENLVYDVEHGIRLESGNRAHTLYIYANRFWGPWYAAAGGGGQKHVFATAPGGNQISPMTTWVYHNTCAGGGWCLDMGATGEVSYTHPNMHFRNNAYSCGRLSSGGTGPIGDLANNFNLSSLWCDNTMPDFWLPTGHAGLNTAPSMAGFSIPFPGGSYSSFIEDGQGDYGARQGIEEVIEEPPVAVATHIVLLTQPSNNGVCPAVGNSIQIQVLDQFNLPFPIDNLPIMLSIATNPGTGVIQGDLLEITTDGIAFFVDWCINEAGEGYTIQASASGLVSGVSSSFDITADQVAHALSIVEYPINMNTNTVATANIVVHVLDSTGQLVSDSTAEVTLGLSDPGTAVISGTLVKNAVGGVVTYTDIKVNKRGDSYRFLAEAEGLVDGLSGIVAVDRDFASGQQAASLKSTVISGIRTRR